MLGGAGVCFEAGYLKLPLLDTAQNRGYQRSQS